MSNVGLARFGTPYYWSTTGSVAVVRNGNEAWGGLTNMKTGCMYYAGIQNKGSSLRQTVSNLPNWC